MGCSMKPIEDIKILVVGDIMLDKYVECEVNRLSPEAPVAICNVINEYHSLGGAGNVVRNICGLGAQVDCVVSVGPDSNAKIIEDELEKIGARPFLVNASEKTIVKERIIADKRKVQMLRIDREVVKSIAPIKPIKILEKLTYDKYDIIVVSDYAKGMITSGLMGFLNSREERIIVDPKPINGGIYNGVFMVTPNEKEWEQMSFTASYTLSTVKYILETKGSQGMILMDNVKETEEYIPADPVKIHNVSGAGDSVVAIMSICLSLGLTPLQSAKIANKCGTYVVTQPGTSIVPKNIFIHNFDCVIRGK